MVLKREEIVILIQVDAACSPRYFSTFSNLNMNRVILILILACLCSCKRISSKYCFFCSQRYVFTGESKKCIRLHLYLMLCNPSVSSQTFTIRCSQKFCLSKLLGSLCTLLISFFLFNIVHLIRFFLIDSVSIDHLGLIVLLLQFFFNHLKKQCQY